MVGKGEMVGCGVEGLLGTRGMVGRAHEARDAAADRAGAAETAGRRAMETGSGSRRGATTRGAGNGRRRQRGRGRGRGGLEALLSVELSVRVSRMLTNPAELAGEAWDLLVQECDQPDDAPRIGNNGSSYTRRIFYLQC